jgi:hypothetical protein
MEALPLFLQKLFLVLIRRIQQIQQFSDDLVG